jgi:hypothetical protein
MTRPHDITIIYDFLPTGTRDLTALNIIPAKKKKATCAVQSKQVARESIIK